MPLVVPSEREEIYREALRRVTLLLEGRLNPARIVAGSLASALTAGSGLTATPSGTFDGSVARTFAVNSASTATAGKIVLRDSNGDFAARYITVEKLIATSTSGGVVLGDFVPVTWNTAGEIRDGTGGGGGLDIITLNSNSIRFISTGYAATLLEITNAGKTKFAASASGHASLQLLQGTTPSSPQDGDIWYDGSHFYGRLPGVTKQLDN